MSRYRWGRPSFYVVCPNRRGFGQTTGKRSAAPLGFFIPIRRLGAVRSGSRHTTNRNRYHRHRPARRRAPGRRHHHRRAQPGEVHQQRFASPQVVRSGPNIRRVIVGIVAERLDRPVRHQRRLQPRRLRRSIVDRPQMIENPLLPDSLPREEVASENRQHPHRQALRSRAEPAAGRDHREENDPENRESVRHVRAVVDGGRSDDVDRQACQTRQRRRRLRRVLTIPIPEPPPGARQQGQAEQCQGPPVAHRAERRELRGARERGQPEPVRLLQTHLARVRERCDPGQRRRREQVRCQHPPRFHERRFPPPGEKARSDERQRVQTHEHHSDHERYRMHRGQQQHQGKENRRSFPRQLVMVPQPVARYHQRRRHAKRKIVEAEEQRPVQPQRKRRQRSPFILRRHRVDQVPERQSEPGDIHRHQQFLRDQRIEHRVQRQQRVNVKGVGRQKVLKGKKAAVGGPVAQQVPHYVHVVEMERPILAWKSPLQEGEQDRRRKQAPEQSPPPGAQRTHPVPLLPRSYLHHPLPTRSLSRNASRAAYPAWSLSK